MEKETYTVNLNSAVALPLQIKEDLLSKINAGCPGPEKKILSEIKLAKLYGVSRMTVRQAIIELINEGVLCRVPGKGTFIASSVSESPDSIHHLIPLLVPNLRQPFFYQIIQGAEKTLTKNGYEFILHSVNEDYSEERDYLKKLLKYQAKGLILVAGKYSHVNFELLQKIRRKIPLVIVDVVIPGLEADQVISDDRNGAFLIVSHFIELGHKNILHLAGPKGDSSAENRLAGYKEALNKFQIKYRPELVRFTDWRTEEGFYETKKFLTNGFKKDKITAIFACNDEVAIGVFKALSTLKLKVPDDVAVAGYGNFDIGRFLDVPLTTVNQFAAEMGKTAVNLLLEKLSGKRRLDERKEVVLPTKLLIRQSCGIEVC